MFTSSHVVVMEKDERSLATVAAHGTVDVHVAVDAALHLAIRRTGQGHPAVNAVDEDIEGLAVERVRLRVPAPAVDELMVACGHPLDIEHAQRIDPFRVILD